MDRMPISREAGLRLDNLNQPLLIITGASYVPGKPAIVIIARIYSNDIDEVMPPRLNSRL